MELSMSQLRELICPEKPPRPVCSMGAGTIGSLIQILVVDGGWVAVGPTTREGDFYTVRQGATVRRWGTTSGLGQIASGGPLPDTKLDRLTLIRIPIARVSLMYDCNEEAWRGKFN